MSYDLKEIKKAMNKISFNGKVKLSYSIVNGRVIITPDFVSMADFFLEELYNDNLIDFTESTDTQEKTLICNLRGESGNIHIGAITSKELHILQFAVTMVKALEIASMKNDLPDYYKNNKILKEILKRKFW